MLAQTDPQLAHVGSGLGSGVHHPQDLLIDMSVAES